MQVISLILVLVILVTSYGTVTHSVRSRRAKKGAREAIRAKMNMHMGTMFLCIAGLLMLSFNGAAFQFVAIILIALLGLFNLFAGYRNYQQFKPYL